MAKRKQKPSKKVVKSILDHVGRFTITTAQCAKIDCFPNKTIAEVEQLLRAMKNERLLASQELFGPEELCYHFGPRAVAKLGLAAQEGSHLGTEALIRAYGVLFFVCLSREAAGRSKLTEQEFRDYYPAPEDSKSRPPASHYYVSQQHGVARLGHIRVDIGGSYRNIVKNAERGVTRRSGHPELTEVFQEQAFEQAIVTTTEEKKRQMECFAQEHSFPVPLIVEAHPKLLYLHGDRIQKRAGGNAPRRREALLANK